MTSLRLLARALPRRPHSLVTPRLTFRAASTTPTNHPEGTKDLPKADEAFSTVNLPATRAEPGGLAVWMDEKVNALFPDKRFRAAGILLLTDCSQGPKILDFFRILDLPDTYYSWFLVTELHVWMMGTRLKSAPDARQAITMRNALVETLWTDAEARAKLIGGQSRKIRRRQMLLLAEEFNAAMFFYDHGLAGTDMDLATALNIRFYGNAAADIEKLNILVSYVRRTVCVLDHIDMDMLTSLKTFKWLPLIEEGEESVYILPKKPQGTLPSPAPSK